MRWYIIHFPRKSPLFRYEDERLSDHVHGIDINLEINTRKVRKQFRVQFRHDSLLRASL